MLSNCILTEKDYILILFYTASGCELRKKLRQWRQFNWNAITTQNTAQQYTQVSSTTSLIAHIQHNIFIVPNHTSFTMSEAGGGI
jgi:hypothetical protein